MAPKPAPKPKAKKEKEDTPPPTPKPKKAAPTPTPTPKKKTKDEPFYRFLAKDKNPTVPVDVRHEGNALVSKVESTGTYTHDLKLSASASFSLVKTFVIQGGEYDGLQAILLRPAKPFNFDGLPEEVRARIYRHYFAPNGIVGDTIVLEGKRKSNGEVFAKMYADGQKHRVGLLGVNKEIHDKALPIFYSHNLKFESTSTLMEFLSNIKDVRPLITSVTIKTWVKTTSKTAMGILAESPHITRLHIESGVYAEGDPGKAAKGFYDHAYKFLEAVGAAKGDAAAGVDVLSFGKQAFKYKDDKKVEKPWSHQQVEEFKDALRQKLSPSTSSGQQSR